MDRSERPLPPRPVKPELPPAGGASKGGSWVTIALAFFFGAMLLAGFGAFLFVTFGVTFPIFAVGGIFALAGFHYVVWGWWLGGMIRRDAERQEREAAEGKSAPPSGDRT